MGSEIAVYETRDLLMICQLVTCKTPHVTLKVFPGSPYPWMDGVGGGWMRNVGGARCYRRVEASRETNSGKSRFQRV